jgi:Tetratricopeptide repeat
MSNLAAALSKQGERVEADQMHWQTLALQQKVLGPEHLDALSSIRWLARLLSGKRFVFRRLLS